MKKIAPKGLSFSTNLKKLLQIMKLAISLLVFTVFQSIAGTVFSQTSSLTLNINLDQASRHDYLIPPLTLQLLAENAIKHNSVSKETPLVIDLFISQGMLYIRNNVNPKIQKEKSTGLGLQNIVSRYKLLTELPVKIDHATDHFTVALPLLNETSS